MDEQYIIKTILVTLLLFTIVEHSIDMKKHYPFWIINLFSESYIRFALYLLIYVSSCFNIQISILLSIAITLLHVDYLNLIH